MKTDKIVQEQEIRIGKKKISGQGYEEVSKMDT